MGLTEMYPLTKPEDLQAYRWPDPNDDRICGKIFKTFETVSQDDRFIGGSHRDTLWEKAYMLVAVGYPETGCEVPDLQRKPLDAILTEV